MSLINEALKRAKQAQQPVIPQVVAGPAFKTVEPVLEQRNPGGWIAAAVMTLVCVLAVIIVWQSFRRPAVPRQMQVTAQSVADRSIDMDAEAGITAERSADTDTAQPDLSGIEKPSAEAAVVVAIDQVAQPPAEMVPAVEPPPLKLQAIIYHPRAPSAIINGKSLFIGETVGAFRLSAVTRDAATVVSGGRTHVLTVTR